MFAPAAHTQHMNVLKHLDVWSKDWKHSNSTMAMVSLVAQVRDSRFYAKLLIPSSYVS